MRPHDVETGGQTRAVPGLFGVSEMPQHQAVPEARRERAGRPAADNGARGFPDEENEEKTPQTAGTG